MPKDVPKGVKDKPREEPTDTRPVPSEPEGDEHTIEDDLQERERK